MSIPRRRVADLLVLLLVVSLLSAWTVFWPRHGERLSQGLARFWNYRIKAPLLAREGVFKGRYTCSLVNEEAPCAFRLCSLDEDWDLRGNLPVASSFREPGELKSECYVELRGKVTPPGRYGHMGFYARELVVTRILVARRVQLGDCKS